VGGPEPIFDRRGLQSLGFTGFVSFAELLDSWLSVIPTTGGVYAVLRESDADPAFCPANPGGRFKGKDPTVDASVLTAAWIDGCAVIYIGKGDNLQRRLREYARFGRGDPIGHWGGRYIWQLADSADLIVAWRRCNEGETARETEVELLSAFTQRYARLPFANLRS
jgi:hypothetical protein